MSDRDYGEKIELPNFENSYPLSYYRQNQHNDHEDYEESLDDDILQHKHFVDNPKMIDQLFSTSQPPPVLNSNKTYVEEIFSEDELPSAPKSQNKKMMIKPEPNTQVHKKIEKLLTEISKTIHPNTKERGSKAEIELDHDNCNSCYLTTIDRNNYNKHDSIPPPLNEFQRQNHLVDHESSRYQKTYRPDTRSNHPYTSHGMPMDRESEFHTRRLPSQHVYNYEQPPLEYHQPPRHPTSQTHHLVPYVEDHHALKPYAHHTYDTYLADNDNYGDSNNYSIMTPAQSRSMLTCNREFKKKYPNVYVGLCKGLLDVSQLVQNEMIVPLKENIVFNKGIMRSRRAIVGVLTDCLSKVIMGKFPDPQIGPKLIKKIAMHFYTQIEVGIQDAEDDRSVLQWMLRFDIENAIDLNFSTSLLDGPNTTYANVEGSAYITRRKGELLSLLNMDSVYVDMDLMIKIIFLNGGQLGEINCDPLFIDRVQTGNARIAASLVQRHN